MGNQLERISDGLKGEKLVKFDLGAVIQRWFNPQYYLNANTHFS